MKGFLFSLAFVLLLHPALYGEVVAGSYEMAAVRDVSTLETKVLQEWQPWGKGTGIRQKLVEITVCEWWPGQKVRLPVTLLAPEAGGPCRNVVVANAGLQLKAASPSGAMLRLLKERGVGLVLIGMSTIAETPPKGTLLAGMKEHFLQSKDARFTPAWFWGMSDMRALTAAVAEKDVFQPVKVIATGGSKRGVAAAAAGLADDRFTAIVPVVTPLLEPPRGPYVYGMLPEPLRQANERFLAEMRAGKLPGLGAAAAEALEARERTGEEERITLEQARAAQWTPAEMEAANTKAWAVCRVLDVLPALRARGLEMFFALGSNDNVSPGLREVGRRFPDLPVYVVPSGQHGGPKETGLMKSVAAQPDVNENLYAFAQHHFFQARRMVSAPAVEPHWDKAARRLTVKVTFPDGTKPQVNELWWSADRHPDLTLAMEYDAWQCVPMQETSAGSYEGVASFTQEPKSFDFVTVHRHTENGSTLTVSSPLESMENR